jgi:hypothetical protein
LLAVGIPRTLASPLPRLLGVARSSVGRVLRAIRVDANHCVKVRSIPPTDFPRRVAVESGAMVIREEPIIVECGTCGQPYAVSLLLFSSPLEGELTVPAHRDLRNSWDMCDGAEVPAIARGSLSSWGATWSEAHPGALAPEVLDGVGVRARRIH